MGCKYIILPSNEMCWKTNDIFNNNNDMSKTGGGIMEMILWYEQAGNDMDKIILWY